MAEHATDGSTDNIPEQRQRYQIIGEFGATVMRGEDITSERLTEIGRGAVSYKTWNRLLRV